MPVQAVRDRYAPGIDSNRILGLDFFVIFWETVHKSQSYDDLDEKIIKFLENPEPTHVYLGFHTVNPHFRIYEFTVWNAK